MACSPRLSMDMIALIILEDPKTDKGESPVACFRCKLTGAIMVLGRGLMMLCLATLPLVVPSGRAFAASTVTVAITSDFVSRSPYGDSTAQMFGIWCQIYGCLAAYDRETGSIKGLLAESWAQDPNDRSSWIVTLRKGLKRHKDGRELKAEDVAHSVWRIKNDPTSKQAGQFEDIASAEVIDDSHVRFRTRGSSAVLPIETFDQFIITAKDLYDKYGPEKADRDYPLGWGPYALRQNLIGQRMVLEKNKDWPDIKPSNPDRLIFVRVPEAEAQLTALHNGEVQIASVIPPHMVQRLESKPGFTARVIPSAEAFFIGMNAKYSPWNNKIARRAVAYAINKKLIVDEIYRGQAMVLNGPIGRGQFAWSPEMKEPYPYDPQKARSLLEEAGLVGTQVDFTVTTNRFLYDVQAAEAIVPMLKAVGFKVNFSTQEYATQFAEVQRGNRPFYLHSRGNMMDPTAAFVQMFETGITPRVRYSNAEFDKLLAESRTEPDPEKRAVLLQKVFAILNEDEPVVWLWKANNIYGVDTNKVEFMPTPHNRVFGTAITVK
jgi:peptide/nickel transport system substrate-binding protein